MSRFDLIMGKLYAIFGTFTFVCFASYFLKLFIQSESGLPWVVTSGVMACVGIPFLFRGTLRKKLRRAYVPLKTAMVAGMAFFTVTFVLLVGYIFLTPVESAEIDTESDNVYMVLGAQINPNGPTRTLAARLDTALSALEADPDSVCVVSGGKGSDEMTTEAECMKNYLIDRGISEERVIVEDKASNTAENIRFTVALLKEMGMEDANLICISTDTHIPRVELLCGIEGVEASYIKSPTPNKIFLFTTLVREYLSYCKVLLRLY